MSRRRRKSRDEHIIEALVPLVALAAFGMAFSPQLRAMAVTAVVFLVGGAVLSLVGFLVWRKWLRGNSSEATASRVNLHHQPEPQKFTSDLLSALEWRRFEILVTLYFEKTNFRAWRSRIGADGGVDILLARQGEETPFACVQCKAWKTYKVGVKPVRELLGVMAGDGIAQGFFVTTGEYTSEAIDFAQGKPLTLISGRQLLGKLNQLPEAALADIVQEISSGDYTTPTCPRCDEKMVERIGPKNTFWGCRNYPRCRQTFSIKDAVEE